VAVLAVFFRPLAAIIASDAGMHMHVGHLLKQHHHDQQQGECPFEYTLQLTFLRFLENKKSGVAAAAPSYGIVVLPVIGPVGGVLRISG
jgi:hypothetical protein